MKIQLTSNFGDLPIVGTSWCLVESPFLDILDGGGYHVYMYIYIYIHKMYAYPCIYAYIYIYTHQNIDVLASIHRCDWVK